MGGGGTRSYIEMSLYSEANKYFEEMLKEESAKLNESLKKKKLKEAKDTLFYVGPAEVTAEKLLQWLQNNPSAKITPNKVVVDTTELAIKPSTFKMLSNDDRFKKYIKTSEKKTESVGYRKKLKEGFRNSPYYHVIKRVMNGDTEAADIVYNWYKGEGSFDEFDNVKQFEEFIKSDVYDMLSAAGDKKEIKIVSRALGQVEDTYAVFTQREGEEAVLLYTTRNSKKKAINTAKEQLGAKTYLWGPDEVIVRACVVANDDDMNVYYSSFAKFLSANNIIYEATLNEDGSISEEKFDESFKYSRPDKKCLKEAKHYDINDLHYIYTVRALDGDGDVEDDIRSFKNKEDAIKWAKTRKYFVDVYVDVEEELPYRDEIELENNGDLHYTVWTNYEDPGDVLKKTTPEKQAELLSYIEQHLKDSSSYYDGYGDAKDIAYYEFVEGRGIDIIIPDAYILAKDGDPDNVSDDIVDDYFDELWDNSLKKRIEDLLKKYKIDESFNRRKIIKESNNIWDEDAKEKDWVMNMLGNESDEFHDYGVIDFEDVDMDQAEDYSDMKLNPNSRLTTPAKAKQFERALNHWWNIANASYAGRDGAEDWLRQVYTPDMINYYIEFTKEEFGDDED